MKKYLGAYLLGLTSLSITALAIWVPSNGAGHAIWPFTLMLAMTSLALGVAGQFGPRKVRAWVETYF